MSNKPSRCVFVGNIPYDATEQQLIEVFQNAGPVVSFRLVFDQKTGKAKGYGFCEFRDAETAMSAMRNLNNFEMNGRTLRVDFAESDKGHDGFNKRKAGEDGPGSRPRDFDRGSSPVTSQITAKVEGMTLGQLYEVIAQMKNVIAQNPEQARFILLNNPQLAYALLQAQVILGMANPAVVQQIIEGRQTERGATPRSRQEFPYGDGPPPRSGPPSAPIHREPPPRGWDRHGSYPPPHGRSAPPSGPHGPHPGHRGPPPARRGGPISHAHGGPAPHGVPAPHGAPIGLGGPSASMEQQKALLRQVMQLTPEEVNRLSPAQRQQVLELQRQIRQQGVRI